MADAEINWHPSGCSRQAELVAMRLSTLSTLGPFLLPASSAHLLIQQAFADTDPAGLVQLQPCVAIKVTHRAGILRVSGGPACSSSGVGEHLLDNFAVCCRNVATCIMDVASHDIVGEVRLQNYVLWVHVHLKKGGNRWKGV